MMQAMRKGTPVKAAAILGLPGTMVTSSDDDYLATPTKPRTVRITPAGTGNDTLRDPAQAMRPDMLDTHYGQVSSTTSAIKPVDLAAKRSLLLGGKKPD